MSKVVTSAEHISLAKVDLKAGDSRYQSAADHIAAAVAKGYSQREAAKQLNRSVGWINGLLKWRTGGFVGTPFGPANVAKRERARARSVTLNTSPRGLRRPPVVPLDITLDDSKFSGDTNLSGDFQVATLMPDPAKVNPLMTFQAMTDATVPEMTEQQIEAAEEHFRQAVTARLQVLRRKEAA